MTRHVLITAIIDMIPEGPTWSLDDQMKWFKAAKEAFAVVYTEAAPARAPFTTQLALPAPRRRRRAVTAGAELTVTQQDVLTVLQAMRKDGDGWIEASLREIAKAAGHPMGTMASVLEALELRDRIAIEHGGTGGTNRYKVATT